MKKLLFKLANWYTEYYKRKYLRVYVECVFNDAEESIRAFIDAVDKLEGK